MKLVEGFDSNYRFVQVAAKRARQLQNGARAEIKSDSKKACRVAMDELKAGRVEWNIPETPKTAVEVASEFLAGEGFVE